MIASCQDLYFCSVVLLLASLVPCFAATTSTVPAPIIVSPSQYWEGNDGPWSTFTLQVGTPAQNVRVLISTAGSATWVIDPQGCPVGGITDCTKQRGQLFNANDSTSYKFNDYFELVLETNLGYTGSGAFGFDRVGVGWQGDGGPVLEHQVVAGIATEDFWLGSFGLTPRPTNFSNFNDPQPSFMQTLKTRSMIPSLSWSYTAGAPYRLDKVFGSLVFGGYDASKAGSTNMTFEFGKDISRDLTVGLQAITMSSNKNKNPVELLPEGILTFIDSTVSHIWLPLSACKRFEEEFSLTWNSTVGLYLINDTLHSSLLAQDARLTFKISNAIKGGSTIDITLPYQSFDLTVEYPLVANRTRYFPVVRAANESQYTLGRTFLQEAYLTVDYERSEFYLSQTQFKPGAKQLVIAIPSVNTTVNATTITPENIPEEPTSRRSISTATIAGAAIGGVVAIAVLASIVLVYLRRRRRARSEAPSPALPALPAENTEGFQKAELDGGETMKPGHEIGGDAVEHFQPDKDEEGHFEMPGSSVAGPVGLDAVLGELEGMEEPIYEMVGDGPVVQELASPQQEAKETK